MMGKPHVVTGYNEDGKVVLHDIDSLDAASVKQHAYDSHNEYLTNAWRRDDLPAAHVGPFAGDLCMINGARGHYREVDGSLECVADDPSENHTKTTSRWKANSDARDAAYKLSVQTLQDAWKR